MAETAGVRVVSARSQALRRYPALAYLLGASLLALLLPSALTLPQSGPPTLAEYAPVPGQSAGPSNLSALGAAGSGTGAGFGAGGAGANGGPGGDGGDGEGSPGRVIRKPGTKRCVGRPARQTEDPLSPPCIAFFDGDNGGATARGVTASEVTAVLKVNFSTAVGSQETPRIVDCAPPPNEDDNGEDLVCKAYMKYFNDRYQTYGRRVHLWAYHGNTPVDVLDQLKPFAYVGDGALAKHEVVSPTFFGQQREAYQRHAPYVQSFRPDLEDLANIVASYLCRKLNGRNARYAGDPALQTQKRVFGYWTGNSGYGTVDRLVVDAFKSQCDGTIKQIANGVRDASALARFRNDGVTTIIMNPSSNTEQASVTRQATQLVYFPEWFVFNSHDRDLTNPFYASMADPAQWTNAFGVLVDYPRGNFPDQPWYRAYKEGCPDCPDPSGSANSLGPAYYDALALFFYGIQAAGPRLTAANIDKGLHAIEPRPSPDPSTPAAYFAPGNYSFIKDATAIWWDTSGVPPTSSQPGCYRLANDGRRFRAGEWAPGDDDVEAPGRCQGEPFRVA